MTASATTDLHLAIAHHLLFLLLAGVLAFEISAVRSSMDREAILRVARVDAWYGILAVAIIVVGFSRAILAAKGWAYYSVNLFFWAKLGAFAVVGLLSIMPTVEFIRWRKAISANLTFAPAPHGIRNVRRVLFAEAIVFALIPAFAAAMARGYGSLSPWHRSNLSHMGKTRTRRCSETTTMGKIASQQGWVAVSETPFK
jgi:putative membrane protein